jgi:PTH1 family peptidyl-tRNA hydrolase
MLLIIGLGNPEEKYDLTRHNIGFFVIDKLGKKWNFPDFEFSKKFNAKVSKGNISDKEALLIKPETFMNLSGQSVRSILDFYKISPEDMLVVHDDLDIPIGEIRETTDSRSAGHNGVQNIIDLIGTQKFHRIRIGIKPEECIFDASAFVLQKFSEEEIKKIENISADVMERVENSI